MGFCQTQHFFGSIWQNAQHLEGLTYWFWFWSGQHFEKEVVMKYLHFEWMWMFFLGKHLSRLSKTQTFRMNNLSTFLSLTAMSWPEPNEKADRSTGVQVQGQDRLSCQVVNAENCSLVRTCTREYTHHCPRHHHHHRHRHLQEKTKTKTKTRTSKIVRNCRQEQTPPCPDRRTDMWSNDRNKTK